MENNPDLPPAAKKSSKKLAIFFGSMLLATTLAGGGLYYWQHTEVNSLASQINSLQMQLKATKSANNQISNKPTTPGTFTYSPKAGGLSLALPKTYGIIVNIDGNYGGAPGALFRVGSVLTSNSFSDGSYEGLQIEIGNTFTTLDHAVSSEESRLEGEHAGNFKVSNTTVAGLPAKLITADGADEYVGQLSVYVVGSGSFAYTITANGAQFNDATILPAVLKGISIKPVTL